MSIGIPAVTGIYIFRVQVNGNKRSPITAMGNSDWNKRKETCKFPVENY